MSWFIRQCSAIFQTYYALMMAYRGEIMLWAVATALPLIMAGIWVEAGKSGRFSLDAVQFARYWIAAYFVKQLTTVWYIHDFEWHVVSGRLSPMLLQPLNPNWRFLIAHFSEQAVRVPFACGLLVLALFIFPEALFGDSSTPTGEVLWLPSGWQIALALISVYMFFLIRFMMQFCVAMGCFWFERVVAWENIMFIVMLFASGMVFPLSEVPASVRGVLLWTPFPYMVWFPAMLLGDANALFSSNPGIVLQALTVFGVWGIALFGLATFLWKRGLRHYSAMGA